MEEEKLMKPAMHAYCLIYNTAYYKTNKLANYSTKIKEYISSYGKKLPRTSISLQGPSHLEEQLHKHCILAYAQALLSQPV